MTSELMSETMVPPTLEVDRRIDIGLHLAGALACMSAAYYTGQTGNWEPLALASIATGLVVLFVTSE